MELCEELINLQNYINYHEKCRSWGNDNVPECVINACKKQIPTKPIIWEGMRTPESPTPNDDWGYRCPMCGNEDIDYPQHHCECGQALKWEFDEEEWFDEEM